MLEGEIYGFIGPNGAGKSTTIRTLLDLIHPTSGSATVFGKDIATSGAEIRQDVGYLPSEVFYYDDMRAIDLLKYSASFYNKDLRRRARARIRELAERFDLDLKKKIDDLSYGNKKKVGIIQGLAHRAETDHPGRAHRRARPADPAGVLRTAARGEPGRRDGAVLVPHPV